MQSQAKTVSQYINSLSSDRRKDIKTVRALIKKHLPNGYKETMLYGMITFVVPLKTYPAGYGGNPQVPLSYIGLASQKNYLALYLMGTYADKLSGAKFRKDYAKSGKKLDMGKSCVRFKRADDLALDVIGKTIASMPVKKFMQLYDQARSKLKSNKK